ncbi:signal transduction histidine kinase [Georgenia soli]|uniref:Signal transduction histidine kinase n=2 Tax=Georgenia soli TaxID=638953 RepID=A0A2A9EHU8_9MICO|nr:signal transduction histidine kinase [Georgenia soli]
MQAGVDLLVAVLCLLVALGGGAATAVGVGFALVHAAGRTALGGVVRSDARPDRRRAALVWAALLTVLAVVAAVVSPAGIWLAFPVFLVQLHVLPAVPGVLAVAATTAVTVATGVWRAGPSAGAVLGPAIGAGVCVGVVLGVRAVIAEAEERRTLLQDLVEARDVLAERERADAVVAERERLAREIHDTLAQGLASIELVLRAADVALGAGDVARARELVATARTTSAENLAEARAFVRDLPSPSVRAGLTEALTRLAAQTAGRTGLAVDVRASGEARPLPQQVEQTLWRVAQQALANTAEHAAARRATVTLSYLGDAVALDVVDDGDGFDPSAPVRDGRAEDGAPGRGRGLAGMSARVAELGGTLHVESAPGRGTAVAAEVPL